MYDEGGELLNEIKNMYVESSACVRVNGGESEQFRIDKGVRQGCIMSPWLFDGVRKNMGIGKRGVRFMKDSREWRLPGLLYADDLVLCG